MKIASLTLCILIFMTANVKAGDYIIDKKGMHASIQFKISHLGYSWLWGRFNDFDGRFNYDKNKPEASKIEVFIETKSVDSNHALRDKHIRGKDLLEVDKYPQARFISTSFTQNKDGTGIVKGDFTLHGVTKPISINIQYIGEGKDPWGGYRIGFEGTSRIVLADYNITKNLGPASKELDLFFAIEGIKK
ncbi:MAG: YceI family protein [gamma proteobacterium symbiont of Taylorina sp.]|nr:YceI family protein [gamma proteobacterium symbiont of Taylorina sp.]